MSAQTIQTEVLEALKKVQDPDLGRDIVSLGMVRDIQFLPSGELSFRVVLTTPACPMKAKIEADCREAVSKIEDIKKVTIQMDAEVRSSHRPAADAVAKTQVSQSGPIAGVAHIIAVSSGKGGVGKSTVAVNLATALALTGARVGLLDADVYGPNTPTMMGVMGGPKIFQDPQKGEMFVPPESHGVKVMSMGFLLQGDQPLIWRGPMLHNIVNQFCFKVLWGELDYLVVDMPPGTGDVQLSLAQLVPVTGAVLVTTPQEVSMQDVRKAFHMFETVRVPVLGIVENMSYFQADATSEKHYIFGKNGGELLARKLNSECLAQLPIVQAVREGGDEGVPVVIRNPNSEVAKGFIALAGKVAQKVAIQTEKQNPNVADSISIGKF